MSWFKRDLVHKVSSDVSKNVKQAIGKVQLPDVTLRRPRMGQVTLQDMQLPDMTLPRPRLGEVTVQDIQLPDVTLPRPRMGEVTVQDVQLPNVTLPRPRMGEVEFKDVIVKGPNLGRPVRALKRTTQMAVLALFGLAMYKEMSQPEDQRQWHGRMLGVPYDFRPPTSQRFRDAWWNERAGWITTTPWGLGWTINFHRLTTILMSARSGRTRPD
jgi:hypothetical protein